MDYPFCAVVGNEKAKRALLCALINPAVGGALLCGEKGTGKSLLIRSLESLGVDLIQMPLHSDVSELYGREDWEAILHTGKKKKLPGILERAEGGFLYVDEVNLLEEETARCVSHAGMGTVLFGSMDPKEGTLFPGLLERFGLFVQVEGEQEVRKRAEIIRRFLEYESDREAFSARFLEETKKLKKKLEKAMERLPFVQVTENGKRLAAELTWEAACEGNRTELYLVQAGRALAALDGKFMVAAEHLLEAAGYVFPHRGEKTPDGRWEVRQEVEEEEKRAEEKEGERKPESGRRTEGKGISSGAEDSAGSKSGTEYKTGAEPGSGGAGKTSESHPEKCKGEEIRREGEKQSTPGKLYSVNGWLKDDSLLKKEGEAGRRFRGRPAGNRGHVAYGQKGMVKEAGEIDFGATFLSAALEGGNRKKETGLCLSIHPEDIHRKVRRGKCGAAILFAVDASASMGARERMSAVKGMVLSLLQDSYEKRDKVALLTFRGERAELLLEFTGSVELAARRMAHLKTGGRTPLAEGIRSSYNLLKGILAKERNVSPALVLITDGRATMGTFGEALEQAERLRGEPISCTVVDTEQGRVRLNLAKKLAEAMEGNCITMKELENEYKHSGI